MRRFGFSLVALLALTATHASSRQKPPTAAPRPARAKKRGKSRPRRAPRFDASSARERSLAPWDWLPRAILHEATILPDGSARLLITFRGDLLLLRAPALRLAPNMRAGDDVSLLVLEDGTASLRPASASIPS